MNAIIEVFGIFCILAFKYWFIFIPIVVALTYFEISED